MKILNYIFDFIFYSSHLIVIPSKRYYFKKINITTITTIIQILILTVRLEIDSWHLAWTIAIRKRDIKRVDDQKIAGCGTRKIPSAIRGMRGPQSFLFLLTPTILQTFLNDCLAWAQLDYRNWSSIFFFY